VHSTYSIVWLGTVESSTHSKPGVHVTKPSLYAWEHAAQVRMDGNGDARDESAAGTGRWQKIRACAYRATEG